MRTVITALVLAVVVGVGFMNAQAERLYQVYLHNLERTSRYEIQNATSYTITTLHEFYAYGSGSVASTSVMIPPNSSIVVNCAIVDALPSPFSGYVLITSDGPIMATLLPTYKAYLPVIGYEGIQ